MKLRRINQISDCGNNKKRQHYPKHNLPLFIKNYLLLSLPNVTRRVIQVKNLFANNVHMREHMFIYTGRNQWQD